MFKEGLKRFQWQLVVLLSNRNISENQSLNFKPLQFPNKQGKLPNL